MDDKRPCKFVLELAFETELIQTHAAVFSSRNTTTKEMLEFGPLKHFQNIWILRRFFEAEREEFEQELLLNHDGTLSDNDDQLGINNCNIVFTQ